MSILDEVLARTLNGKDDSDHHLMTLFSIAIEMRAQRILELGVRYGTTTTPFLLAASMLTGSVTSVDLNPTNYVPPTELKPFHKFIQSDAISFLEKCITSSERFDLIFVDDWHAYAHVKKELELLSKMMNDSTIVLLHDLMGGWHHPYYWCPNGARFNGGEWEGGGPYRAIYELDINEFEWSTIPVNNGLTILRRRSDPIIE